MHFKTPHSRQSIGHKVRVGAAITLFTGAFLLTSGIFTKAYSQDKKPKGGDTVLLMQTVTHKPIEQVKKDTTKTMDTIPKIVVPDVRSFEHYNPYPWSLTDSMFLKRDSNLGMYRDAWMDIDDHYSPFGVSNKVLSKYSPEERKELDRRWKIAKIELIVAFLSDRGIPPSSALDPKKGGYEQNSKEVQDMLKEWQILKDLDRRNPTVPEVK